MANTATKTPRGREQHHVIKIRSCASKGKQNG